MEEKTEKTENALVVKDPDKIWTEKQIDTIRNTVAIGANDRELNMYLTIAAKYELDPFLHEIWFTKIGDRNTIITGRDGYLKIANRHPEYNGMISDVVCAGDKFLKDGDIVKHAYDIQNRGAIIGAYAVVYRKDREHPSYFFAPFREYNKGGRGVWGQYPSAMIIKVAEAMALKRAFSISGLVTEEEIGGQESSQNTGRTQQAQEKRKTAIHRIWTSYLSICGNASEARITMTKITGKNSTSDYTDEDIKNLEADLQRHFTEPKTDDAIDVDTVEKDSEELEVKSEK